VADHLSYEDDRRQFLELTDPDADPAPPESS